MNNLRFDYAKPKVDSQEYNYTLVGKMIVDKDEKMFFSNFGKPEDVLTNVSNMSKGPNKVHAIYRMDIAGQVEQMTIGFEDGRLGLIKINKDEEVNNWNK